MTDRPIIFSGPMVRALLDGRKTQTRRVLPNLPSTWEVREIIDGTVFAFKPGFAGEGHVKLRYAPGDRLWVREAWGINDYRYGGTQPIPKQRPADLEDDHVSYLATESDAEIVSEMPYRPSIHMPRWASRLTLIVEGVRVERLQQISRDDAIAEGAISKPNCSGYANRYEGWSMNWREPASDHSLATPQLAFGSFINELHGGPSWNIKNQPPLWEQNPWVVAVSFRVVRANIDKIIDQREVAA